MHADESPRFGALGALLPAALLALTAPLLAGCDDELKSVDRIEEPRVLAARVEVDAEPNRASPRAGELVHVRWLVAAPSGDPHTGYALEACSAPPSTLGNLHCAGSAFASGAAAAAQPRPSFDLMMPDELAQSARLAVLGELCANGDGAPDSTRCASGAPLPVSLDFYSEDPANPNTNPHLADDSILLDGAPWLPSDVDSDTCAGLGLPEFSLADGEHELTLSLPESARDPLVQKTSVDIPREELRISHFTSEGELEAPFSTILPSSNELSVRVSWKPPSEAPAARRLVRFWFVVRDLRGGSDFTERALCLLP